MIITLVRPESGAGVWRPFAVALAVFVATLVASPQAPDAAEPCRSTIGAPEVTLKSVRGELAYDGSHSQNDLRRLFLKSGGSGRWHGGNPVGLTLADLELDFRIEVRARPLSKARFCTELARVDATLGYRSLDVYVARRYRRGTCEYEQVLDHENHHVAIFRDGLMQYGPRVRDALERTSRAQAPLVTSAPGTGAERFKDRLHNQLAPLFRDMNRALDRAHATLDTAENYRAEQRRCANW
ncbi:MAG: hypothetical protein QF902_06560 [Rhodospirillales bacterium]|jgi:hypothetical protein|nr:hypothetical protein [Rhodospirillales bacterium]